MVLKAVCCCGSSSIEVSGEPTLNAVCHCDNCKRRTGSAFGWQAYFQDTQIVAVEGEFSQYRIRTEQERSFCARCGTTLFWKTAFMPGQTGIAAGAFVDPPLSHPTIEATSARRAAWVSLAEQLTCVT
jgi:hypothetical protein